VFTGANDHARPERRAALAEHVGLVLDLLHHHHTGEDTGLWPLVRRRAPDLGSQLDTMEAEHACVAGAIASTRAAARQYAMTTDSTAGGRRLQQALAGLVRVVAPRTPQLELIRSRGNRAGLDGGRFDRETAHNVQSTGVAGLSVTGRQAVRPCVPTPDRSRLPARIARILGGMHWSPQHGASSKQRSAIGVAVPRQLRPAPVAAVRIGQDVGFS
jgi:hypothetical protein